MFGNLLKATVGLLVEAPIAVAADVITLGGALTEKQKPYTAEALEKVMDNAQKATKPD